MHLWVVCSARLSFIDWEIQMFFIPIALALICSAIRKEHLSASCCRRKKQQNILLVGTSSFIFKPGAAENHRGRGKRKMISVSWRHQAVNGGELLRQSDVRWDRSGSSALRALMEIRWAVSAPLLWLIVRVSQQKGSCSHTDEAQSISQSCVFVWMCAEKQEPAWSLTLVSPRYCEKTTTTKKQRSPCFLFRVWAPTTPVWFVLLSPERKKGPFNFSWKWGAFDFYQSGSVTWWSVRL